MPFSLTFWIVTKKTPHNVRRFLALVRCRKSAAPYYVIILLAPLLRQKAGL